MITLFVSVVLGVLVAAYPERVRGWTARLLSFFPILQKRCVRFIDRLLLALDRRYLVLAR